MNSTPSDPNDENTDQAKNSIIELLRTSPPDQVIDNFNEFITTVGRETSRERHQYYIEPFKLELSDVKNIDSVIHNVLRTFDLGQNVFFDCRVGLNNRQTLSYPSLDELEKLAQSSKSYPVDFEMVWTYQCPIKWRSLTFQLPFKISVEFSANPRQDIKGAMSSTVAPQQYAEVNSKYPPAEPEALRLLAPQRGLFATGHGARECRCADVSDARSNGEEHTPGNVKL